MSVPAQTRLEHEQKQERWDSLTGLVQKEFGSLEAWVKTTAHKHLDELTKILKTDLSDNDIRWECEAQINKMTTLKETWQKKFD